MLSVVNAADIAASAGQAHCLEVALAHGHDASCPKAMEAAVAGGYVECVTLLCKRCHVTVTENTLTTAAKLGHVACVQYIVPVLQAYSIATMPGVGMPWRLRGQLQRNIRLRRGVPGVCDAMAEHGELIALQTLVLGGCAEHMDWRTLWAACRGGASEAIGYAAHPALFVTQCHAGIYNPSRILKGLRLTPQGRQKHSG